MTVRAQRPADGEYAPFYAGYVARVPDGDIVATLRTQIEETCALLETVGERGAGHAYAPGKWTIREVVGHVCDAERVFGTRALRFARGDRTPLPGFDEKLYVPAGQFTTRTLDSLVTELRSIRAATITLFDGLPDSAWMCDGIANDTRVTVRALAWIAAGHERHHRLILAERYLPGLPA